MKKSTKLALGASIGVGTVAAVITSLIVRYGEKEVTRAERQTKEGMLLRLTNQFKVDYKEYENIDMERLEITSEDGLKLTGYFYNNFPDSKKLMIIHHGYTANHYICIQYMKMFLDEGFNILLIDMRAHGESEGKFSSYGYHEVNDLNLWVEAMKKKIGDDMILGLHGQSMGAATVMLFAGIFEEKVDFVIEDCGFSNAEEVVKFKFDQSKFPTRVFYPLVNGRIKRKYKFNLKEVSPKDAIINSKVPTLFIHGTGDTTVPYNMCEEMYNEKKEGLKKIYLVEGAEHMNAYVTDKERYEKEVKDFIKEVLK